MKKFRLTREELFSKEKTSDVVLPRQVLFYLCKNRPMKLIEIKRLLSKEGFDVEHTTILHGIKVIEKLIVEDKDYSSLIKQLNQ